MGGDGEAEADHHAAGVALDGGVEVALAAAEIDDLVELAGDLGLGHAEDGTVHEDVLATGHLGMEACADLQKGADAAAGTDLTCGGAGDLAEELEQRALAGTVAADDADDIALLDLEADVLQGPYIVARALDGTVVGVADAEIGVFFMSYVDRPPAVEVVAECLGGDKAEAVLLAYIIKFYGCWHTLKSMVVNGRGYGRD